MTDSSSGKITRQGITDEVQKLMVVPQGHVLTLPRGKLHHLAMVLEEGGQTWKELGRQLQISDEKLYKFQVGGKMHGNNWCVL